jgi:three-Cys-motif partner protein
VSKYFWVWANVIIPSAKKQSGKIAYIDLFSGPGRFKDGTTSTPLLVLQGAIQDPNMSQMLVTVFNDVNSDNTKSLESEISKLSGIDTLKYKPDILNEEVGEKIVQLFEQMNLIPTLFFVDPWGYKGLSLRLVNSVLKNWGCDCIFFFNYNRINMGLKNPIVEEHMNALFAKERADNLRTRLGKLKPHEREFAIIEELVQALKDMGGNYVLPFGFKNGRGTRTSHHLIFVSKHFKGYELMKEIMAKESSAADQGVPSFQYNAADVNSPNLFEFTTPLENLESSLQKRFAGKTITMNEIYVEHNVGTPYIKRNYKAILNEMEKSGKITSDPPVEKRRKYKGEMTFADDVLVTFPAIS